MLTGGPSSFEVLEQWLQVHIKVGWFLLARDDHNGVCIYMHPCSSPLQADLRSCNALPYLT